MGKSRKRTRTTATATASTAWKKVDVGLADAGDDKNHYDDTNNGLRHADLEADPSEAVGMFFGLEVLDGSQYTVERKPGSSSSRFTILEAKNDLVPVEAATAVGAPTEGESKQLRQQQQQQASEPAISEKPIGGSIGAKRERQKKKRKEKKLAARRAAANKEKVVANNQSPSTPTNQEQGANAAVQTLQWSWLKSGGVQLETDLVKSLVEQGFANPTPIQDAVLAPAILGRRNIVGAAPTGSGKTLAFLLPIYQHLLQQRQNPCTTSTSSATINATETTTANDKQQLPLQALILTPTRELALQIHKEAVKLTQFVDAGRKWIGCLTGGLALAKQKRVLQQQPAVLVATVGRLWELISSREHEHLNDLSQIRFLVIDEADRMIIQGSFPELSRILDAVQSANPMDDESDEEEDFDDNDLERMLGLPGIPGEARVAMLSDDLLAQMQPSAGDEKTKPVVRELDDDEFDEQLEQASDGGDGDSQDEISLPALPPVYRQTFVYSATLTLPGSSKAKKNKKGHSAALQNVDGAIAEILEKARAKGQTKIVDLTNADASEKKGTVKNVATVGNGKMEVLRADRAAQPTATAFRLPPGLKLLQIKCTQLHKDSHLYAYLMTTIDGSSGPSLVFCNSIAAVRRVGATLQTLGLEVRMLHAHMQQRARFKAVESLKDSKARTIVVCSDVAARGLDIPSVASVIHYDAARSIDTFVHRAGRTARGMGEGAVGCSLSLISSGEDKFYSKIVAALKVAFADVPMDGRLLSAAQERVNLASKISSAEDTERKTQRDNQWFKDQAEEAGLELDDDMLEDGLADGGERDKVRLKEARMAKGRLRILLAQPIQTQRFGKFLSTNSAASQPVVSAPTISAETTGRKKKRRR